MRLPRQTCTATRPGDRDGLRLPSEESKHETRPEGDHARMQCCEQKRDGQEHPPISSSQFWNSRRDGHGSHDETREDGDRQRKNGDHRRSSGGHRMTSTEFYLREHGPHGARDVLAQLRYGKYSESCTDRQPRAGVGQQRSPGKQRTQNSRGPRDQGSDHRADRQCPQCREHLAPSRREQVDRQPQGDGEKPDAHEKSQAGTTASRRVDHNG